MTALLQAANLWVEGGCHGRRQTVLQAVDLEITAGQVTLLLGESGAGKTMLARACAGLLPEGFFVSRGTVCFRGQPLSAPDSWKGIRGRKIFYMPQNATSSLNPVLTIGRQIAEYSRVSAEHLQRLLVGMRFADPRRILNSYPFMLSGGENQRCLLAMALAGRAELLILDEPTAELDVSVQADVLRVLQNYQRCYAPAILLISHNLDLINAIAQNLYVMHAGTIVDSGLPVDVLASPGHPYSREIAAYLGSA